jgi:predicted alpha-1,6-mannanase (GH76 family)
MPPLGHGGDLFYDDNDWVALAFAQRYQMAKDSVALTQAEALSKLVVYAWDSNPAHPCPGGDYWTQAGWSHDRNTISNAPGAQLALRLYLATKNTSYRDTAQQRYDWVNSCMLAPDGLYWDHIDLAGNINKMLWSYNQGMMVGASLLLYEATGEETYLQRAEQLAQTSLTFYSQSGRFYTQPVIFNAIFFRNLLILDAVRPHGRYRQALREYTNALAQAVDPATGLLMVQPYTGVPLLNQAGYVQLNALLAWPRGQYHLLA